MVLIDAKYFGAMLRKARRENGINTRDAAKMFCVPRREFVRYERGTSVIPEGVLSSLFYHGFCLKKCKKCLK